MTFKEVQCIDCKCEIQDAIDVIDINILPGCSKPKFQQFEIIGKNGNPISVFLKAGCCNSSLFIEYDKGGLEDDTLTTSRQPDEQTNRMKTPLQVINNMSKIDHPYENVTQSISKRNIYPEIDNFSTFGENSLRNTLITVGFIFLVIIAIIVIVIKIKKRKHHEKSSAVHNRIYNETDTEYSTIAEVSMETVTAEISMAEKKLPLTLTVANDNSPSESEMYYTLEKGTHQHKAVQYDIKDTIESIDSTIIMAPTHQNTENDGYFTLKRQNVVNTCCPYCSGTLSIIDINQTHHVTAESLHTLQNEAAISAQLVKGENGLYASVTGCDEIYDHLSRNTGNFSSEPKRD